MTQTQEITEVNLPVPEPVKVHLLPGRFFISKHGDTWCCYNCRCTGDRFIYYCVRLDDNFVGQFKENGSLRYQYAETEVEADTLVAEACDEVTAVSAPPLMAAYCAGHSRLLTTVDTLIDKAGEIGDLVQSQAADLAESNFRLSYIRELLGKVANACEPSTAKLATTAAIMVQDALLWLAERELNERKLGLPL